MKAIHLNKGLEIVKSAVATNKDVLIIDKGWLRVSDGVWSLGYKVSEDFSEYMVVSFLKLKSIAKTLGEKDQIEISQKNTNCVVKSGFSVWSLNLKELEDSTPVELTGKDTTIVMSGYALNDAIKELKHLMRTDLARPSLLLAWINDAGEMIVGDGYRIGGRHVGEEGSGMEIPISVVLEIGRQLTLKMSEKVHILSTKERVTVWFDNAYLVASPLADSFEIEWYQRIVRQTESANIKFKVSRSELENSIARVLMTSGMNILVLKGKGQNKAILSTRDESGQKSITEMGIIGNLADAIQVDIRFFNEAVKARSDEMLNISIGKSIIKIDDTKGWEILNRKEEKY